MTGRNSLILLLKSTDDENIQDPYIEELKKQNLKAVTISTLSFKFLDIEKLANKLINADYFRGLILTSKRSVEAVALAADQKVDAGPKVKDISILQKWKEKSVYVVGPATFSACKQRLALDGVGRQCGSAEELSNVIGQDVPDIDENRPLLFPCSSMKRDTLPKTLNEMGIPVECFNCYQTIPSPNLEEDISNFVRMNGFPGVVVFFSPSGVKTGLPVLRKVYDTINPNRGSSNKNTLFAAIGPTTASSLRESGNLWFNRNDQKPSEKREDMCWCIANEPNPLGLGQALGAAITTVATSV